MAALEEVQRELLEQGSFPRLTQPRGGSIGRAMQQVKGKDSGGLGWPATTLPDVAAEQGTATGCRMLLC